jgi:hypothetical protein
MELESIKSYLGEKILKDGIPAVLFLDFYTQETLMKTTQRLIKLFQPNLILGISNELPQGADLEAIERVRLVADCCGVI